MKFKEKLKTKEFLITAELFPPKGTDISSFVKRAEMLKNLDAVNVTDNQRSSMRASSAALCKVLLDLGIEPILQITSRDRNRIAIQSDMIGANILGIENILLLSGDHPNISENSKAKPVYDLDASQMIKTARLLETGIDLAGKKLQGAPHFCIGAVTNPSALPIELQTIMYEKKVLAGAEFFQTQTVFDIQTYKNFYEKIKPFGIKTLAGITLIKSPNFMSFLQKLPGINIPKEIQNRINAAQDPLKEGIKICVQLIKDLQSFADGAHIMAIGMEEYIPEILKDLS